MATDLKKENLIPLTAILTSTLAVLSSIQFGVDQIIDHASSLKELGLAAIFTAISWGLANFLPANLKHALIYIGHKNALPGHRCHKICTNDPRINVEKVSALWPEIFDRQTPEKDRNSLWYSKIYAAVRDTPEVLQSHRNFLLYRDSFSSILLMFLTSIAWYFSQEALQTIQIQPWVPFALALEAFVFMYLATIWGNRMVVTSIARASS